MINQSSEPQERFLHFSIVRRLSIGVTGHVFEAFQTGLDRRVALKVISNQHDSNSRKKSRFLFEMQIMASLQHPGIVPILEAGECQSRCYYTMPLYENGSVAERIRQKPLNPWESAELTARIASAIQFAHENNVLHRDIKPGNILIDDVGQPRISDFGIARFVDNDSILTETGTPLGSIGFMSPEQATGDSEQVGITSDVFSIGATLYSLLTQGPPFSCSSFAGSIKTTLEDAPIPPRKLNRRIPKDLQTICMKCLEKKPEWRYQSAKDLEEDLNRFLSNEPISAKPASPTVQSWRWIKRHKKLTGFFCGFCVGLAGIVALATWVVISLNAKFEERHAKFQLPTPSVLEPKTIPKLDNNIVLNVRPNGRVGFQGKELTPRDAVNAIVTSNPDSEPEDLAIRIRVERNLPYEKVKTLMDVLANEKIWNVSISVFQGNDSSSNYLPE